MNFKLFREYCLSLKGATEKMPFGKANNEHDRNLVVFAIEDKWFGFVNAESFEFCNLKCDPEENLRLQDEFEGIRPGYHMNHRHWMSVYFNCDVPDNRIFELVKTSYFLVLKSLPKRVQVKYL